MMGAAQIKKLNPVMAAAWLARDAHLTEPGRRTLELAIRNGGWGCAGTGQHAGRLERVSASSMASLERRGFLTATRSPDGGAAAVLSQRSMDALAKYASSGG
jgi:hypothetical protein